MTALREPSAEERCGMCGGRTAAMPHAAARSPLGRRCRSDAREPMADHVALPACDRETPLRGIVVGSLLATALWLALLAAAGLL